MGITELYLSTVLQEQFPDGEGRGLSDIINVGLVSKSEHEYLGAIKSLLAPVETLDYVVYDKLGHLDVDLSSPLDEVRLHTHGTCLPHKVEGVDGNAVTTPAGTRVEALEAKWLCRSGIEHLPHINVELLEDHLQLVHKSNVHGTVDVLDELGRLGYTSVRHTVDLVEGSLVEGLSNNSRLLIHTTEELRDGLCGEVFVTGILTLRRIGKEVVLSELKAGLLQATKDVLI
mmetsp:Transcript_47873/g.124256  ORF Transcript_47873/g.124256 Transcript_47873/m.124256 type:complete len:230 (+) Transcript_47873:660-1349(+)